MLLVQEEQRAVRRRVKTSLTCCTSNTSASVNANTETVPGTRSSDTGPNRTLAAPELTAWKK